MNIPTHKPVRVALIGVSGYGGCHYKSLLALAHEGTVKLCAATVINPAAVEEKCAHLHAIGARIYDDYQEMLKQEAGRIDLCCIPTGIGWHRDMTVAALEAGMHVLVEKPAAATLEDVDAMLDAQRRSGLHVFVGFQNMYSESLWDIKRLLIAGKLGQLERIRVGGLWPRSITYYERTDWAGKITRRGVPIFDSPANNAMAHFILMGLFWGGRTLERCAQIDKLETGLYRAQRIESFDTFSAHADMDNGAELSINMTHSAERYMAAEVVVEATNGRYRWSDREGSTLTFFEKGKSEISLSPYSNTRVVMLSHICDVLRGKDSCVCTLEMAREHTRFMEQVHRDMKIETIPSSYLQTGTYEGEPCIQVKGLADALVEAYRGGTLLRHVGLPWAPSLATSIPSDTSNS